MTKGFPYRLALLVVSVLLLLCCIPAPALCTDTDQITVRIIVLGDTLHDSDKDGVRHTLNDENLTVWIPLTVYSLPAGSNVKALLDTALADYGMSCRNPTGNYVESMTRNGVSLGEFDNGKKSGWMYTLNEYHPFLGLNEQLLHDGDLVLWHYTDDYSRETGLGENVIRSFTLNEHEISVEQGDSFSLFTAASPVFYAGAELWESDDPKVATVENGEVVGLTPGVAHITAKIGPVSDSCEVTVTACTEPKLRASSHIENATLQLSVSSFGLPAEEQRGAVAVATVFGADSRMLECRTVKLNADGKAAFTLPWTSDTSEWKVFLLNGKCMPLCRNLIGHE